MPTSDIYSDAEGSVEVGEDVKNTGVVADPLLAWIKREKAAAMSHVLKWRSEAERCYRFRDGKQLESSDAKALKDAGRPDNAFNTVQKFIRFVTGVERHTPEALLFEPIDETDVNQQTLGEVMTRFYDWAISNSSGNSERSRAFDDLIVAGMGWGDAYVERGHDPKGMIAMKRIPGDEMIWPESDSENLSDTRWRAREMLLDKDEAASMFPDKEDLIKTAGTGYGSVGYRPEAESVVVYNIPYIQTKPISASNARNPDQTKVRILEWQWYDNKPGYYFYDPLEKEDVWYDTVRFNKYKSTLARVTGNDPNYRIDDFIRQTKRLYQKILILEDRWPLTEVMEMPGSRFTFNCMTGYYDDEDKIHYGYMRVLIDPQRFANKFFNQVIEIMGTAAKGGGIYEEGAIPSAGVTTFEKKYSQPGSWNAVAPTAITQKKFMFKPLPELPASSIAIVEFCVKAMENVTGIDPETAFGQGSTNMPGITLKQKQKSGLLLLNQEFGALSRYRIEEGRIIFDLLKTLADDRLIRVGKPYDGSVLRLMRAPFAMEYDLMLDDTERDPNIRHLYAETIIEMAPTLIRMDMFLPEMLDFMPIPVQFRQKLKKAMIAQGQAKQEMAEKGIQQAGRGQPVSPEERQAKIQLLQAETAVNVAKARRLGGQQEKDMQKMELDRLKGVLLAVSEAAKLRQDKERAAADIAQKAAQNYLENKKIETDYKANIFDSQVKREAAQRSAREAERNGSDEK